MSLAKWLLVSLGVAAFAGALPLRGATALPWSRHIPLLSPADGARIAYAGPDEVVTFRFHVDSSAVLAEAAKTGDSDWPRCGVRISFFVTCEGAACKPGAQIVRNEQDTVPLTVRALLALTNGDASAPHAFVWGAQLGYVADRSASPPCVGVAIAATEARFALVPEKQPQGPPDLSLALDPDVGGVWPKSIAVTDKGGPSKATFLVVSVKTLFTGDAAVARNCALVDGSKTHTVEAMPGGGTKRSFDVPPLPPSQAQREALLKAMAPAAAPTPGKSPQKAALQPTITYHDPNVHQVVTCRYQLDARLGADTNARDPNRANNSLSRTIAIDVKLN